jgi:hypothetical protein
LGLGRFLTGPDTWFFVKLVAADVPLETREGAPLLKSSQNLVNIFIGAHNHFDSGHLDFSFPLTLEPFGVERI